MFLSEKGAWHTSVYVPPVIQCLTEMRAGCDESCSSRDAWCPRHAVEATSLELVGLKQSALALSAVQPAASATAGTLR